MTFAVLLFHGITLEAYFKPLFQLFWNQAHLLDMHTHFPIKKGRSTKYHDLSSGRAGIQTPNLLIRSEMLYSIELRTLVFVCPSVIWECKCKEIIHFTKYLVWPGPQLRVFLNVFIE